MPAAGFPLGLIQRWMQAVIEHPAAIGDAVRASRARRLLAPGAVDRLILPSKRLTPLERVEVYQGMYLLRMRDALRFDYPGVARALGEHDFWHVVVAYVKQHPSTSFTLNRLGDSLPRFLATLPGLARRGFLVDLARYELLLTQAFDAEETKALTPAELERIPATAWERAVLLPTAAFRLGEFSHDVGAWLDASEAGRRPPRVVRRSVRYALHRRDYRVRRLPLSPSAYALLERLARGQRLGRAVAAVLAADAKAEPFLFDWFREWTRAGLFRAVKLDARRARKPAAGGARPRPGR